MRTRYIFISCVLLFISALVYSQNLGVNNDDLSNIKVEELSDGQIKQIIQRAEESGMTESQMKAALVTRGMQSGELIKLEARMNSLKSDKSSFEIINRDRQDVLISEKDGVQGVLSGPGNQAIEGSALKDKLFGYSLFRNENLSFEPSMNIPTPPDYQIGPGDQLFIDVWGASQQNYQLPVSPDGTIFIENLGPINVTGLSIAKASDRIIGRLEKIYSGLGEPNRNTYAEITLGNTRTISVHI